MIAIDQIRNRETDTHTGHAPDAVVTSSGNYRASVQCDPFRSVPTENNQTATPPPHRRRSWIFLATQLWEVTLAGVKAHTRTHKRPSTPQRASAREA